MREPSAASEPGGQVPPPPAAVADRGPSRRRVAVLAGCAAGVVLLDVITKIVVVAKLSNHAPVVLIPSVLDLELTRNSGAAFSIAEGGTILFSLIAIVIIAVIIRAARTLRSMPWAVVLGLVLGGALGNLNDRIFRAPSPLRGHVVDWIHLHHWPIFNLADSAIVVGGVIAVILSARGIGLTGPTAAAGDEPAGGVGG
jgi:signal peptidase II